VKEAFRNRTALRIQNWIRKFVGKSRFLRRKRLVDILVHHVHDYAPLFAPSPTSSSQASSPEKYRLDAEQAHEEVFEQLLNQVVRILHKLFIMNQFHQALVDTERTLQLIDMQMMIYEDQEQALLNNFDITNSETWPNEQSWSVFQSHTPILMILRTILLIIKGCCWAKYGRTKQVNINILEQTMGMAMIMMYEQRRYFAMWCQRRRVLANERDRLIRDYESKLAAAEATQLLHQEHHDDASSRRTSSMSNMSGRRHTNDQDSKTAKHRNILSMPNVLSTRKASVQSLSSREHTVHSFANMPLPPKLPIVPEFLDVIQTSLHRRVWHQFSIFEIVDVFHTIASWPRYSLLTQYDACFCKGSILHALLYCEHWQEVSAGSIPQLFRDHQLTKEQKLVSSDVTNEDEESMPKKKTESVTASHQLKLPRTNHDIEDNEEVTLVSQESLSQLNLDSCNDSLQTSTSQKSNAALFIATEYTALKKLIFPLFGFAIQNSPEAFRYQNNTARNDTSEQDTTHLASRHSQQNEEETALMRSKYDHMHSLMQRAWRLTERAKHLISTGSPESYELYQRLEFVASSNVSSRILFKKSKELQIPLSISPQLLKVNESTELKSSPNAIARSPMPGEGKQRRKKEQSGSLQFQKELSTNAAANGASDADDVKVTLTLSVSYHVMQAGAMIFVFGHIDDLQLHPTKYMTNDNWIDSCLKDTPYREVPYFLQRFGSVPLQPFVLFSHELKQLATSQNLYVVRGALYKPSATTTLTAVDEDDNEDNHDDDEDREQAKANEAPHSSLSKKPVLDQRRFQEYIHDMLSLSYVPILSSVSATASFNIPYHPLIFQMDGKYIPPASTRIQPRLAVTIPFVQEKRDRSINFNEVRYATMLLQRCYRGYAGRLRFKRIAVKKREIMRRWWLACKVLDRWKLMRLRHERGAIRVQSLVKGWMWRRRLRKMHAAALRCQCKFRIYRAICKAWMERMRRDGGPQVYEMLRGGRLVEVFQRRFMLNVFRCGYNYRLEGFDMIRGTAYHGSIHQPELAQQLQQYNHDVVLRLQGDRNSLASKQAQIQLWQHEKVVQYIVQHITLVHRVHGVTNAMGGTLADKGNDLCLVVLYESPKELHPKLQAPQIPDLMNHPAMEYVKFKPSPFSSFKALRQQEQQRQQQRRQPKTGLQSKSATQILPANKGI
jgi:hypothetical protein